MDNRTVSAKNVIVVTKGTAFDRVDRDDVEVASVATTEAGYEGESYRDRLSNSHHAHIAALARVMKTIEKLGWAATLVERDAFEGCEGYDLVLSVGGDGTVLDASHRTFGVPLMGVNSDPERSVGYFCATTADGIEAVLKDYQANVLQPFVLHRLKLTVDGEEVGSPALNDVLVANSNPGATSRYVLIAGPRAERQKSSGIWISTPAGSTAGIRSAGGVVLPLEGAQMQYLVREPVFSTQEHYELLRGVRDLEEGLTVVSHMRDGYAYVDGPNKSVPLPLGSVLRISAAEPLTILGLEPERRER
jgi:NAD+ kinase